jgi:hypothetical protein
MQNNVLNINWTMEYKFSKFNSFSTKIKNIYSQQNIYF